MTNNSIDSSHEHRGMDLFFQFGLDRVDVLFDGSDLHQLRQVATDIVLRKYTRHINTCSADNLLLFKHNYRSTQLLELVTTLDSLQAGDTIEIVMKVDYMHKVSYELHIRSHDLHVHSYKTPTFCDLCSVMLFGLHRQGLKCEQCGGNFHKRCALKIPNNCKGAKGENDLNEPLVPSLSAMSRESERRMSEEQWNMEYDPVNAFDSSVAKERRATCPATWANGGSGGNFDGGFLPSFSSRLEIPHTFFIHSYKVPTVCHVCKKLLKGIFRQGLQCKDCKFNCHEKCEDKAPRSCGGEGSLVERDEELNVLVEEMGDQMAPAAADGALVETMSMKTPNIQLQRLVTVRYRTSSGSKVMKKGWMAYFTKTDSVLKTRFWRLDTKRLSMYESDHQPKELMSVSLQDILSVEYNRERPTAGQTHIFILKTISEIYYCGVHDEFDPSGALIAFEKPTGKGTIYGSDWAVKIREAYQPISPQPSAPIPAKRVEQDISEVYQLFSDEILGSGQFGTVYSGIHRATSTHVAIKCIDKRKFGQLDKEMNEVDILQKIDHPAIVNLQRMFRTPENIFIVMEKMNSDMLSYILSSPIGRLSEHQTKVLTYQILVALQFLHSRDIVHCDLKPENVLLSRVRSQNGVPQIKLCDFGFARIIGQESFRRTMVGTPAYVAPEVLYKDRYNRYLDMWSVGVVVYVTLTGTFPYNEAEDIEDQIKNAQFMYPPDPWDSITRDAQEFIGKLLQVKSNSRLAASAALLHAWMRDYLVYLELRSLDDIIGRRYLTNENDDMNWEQMQHAIVDV